MVSVLHTLSGLPSAACNYVLLTMQVGLVGAFLYDSSDSSRSLSSRQQSLIDDIPSDIRTVLKTLDYDPVYTLYACCTKCFALYAPDTSNKDPYPHHCTYRSTPDQERCGAPLVRSITSKATGDHLHWSPIKTFAFQDMPTWLGQLCSRPGLENLMESAWQARDLQWHDIMQSPAIQRFLGPDNKTPFSRHMNGSLHLVFSLFIDWFNPFGNKKAGKSHSVGGIYVACLNLPPHLRYRTENIFLAGIIPGPHEPSLDQINHFLAPLVDVLLDLWHNGVRLSRTATRSSGRLVRIAFIPLVCDLPALRKSAGFAGHSADRMCSFCLQLKKQIHNLDRAKWQRRTWQDHLRIALRWRDAQTQKERDTIFKDHGLRWSELLRLPYWDPTRFSLVDAMHNLYLGELRHHCMEIWGIDIKGKNSDGSKSIPHTPSEQQRFLDGVVAAIKKGSLSAILKPRKGYISAIAELNGVLPDTLTKKAYGKALLAWVSSHGPIYRKH